MKRTVARALMLVTMVTLVLGGSAVAGTPSPEIDPGMATGGLTILGVGIILLLERYRRS